MGFALVSPKRIAVALAILVVCSCVLMFQFGFVFRSRRPVVSWKPRARVKSVAVLGANSTLDYGLFERFRKRARTSPRVHPPACAKLNVERDFDKVPVHLAIRSAPEAPRAVPGTFDFASSTFLPCATKCVESNNANVADAVVSICGDWRPKANECALRATLTMESEV